METATTDLTTIVDGQLGSRRTITRAEMADLLRAMADQGLDLRNGSISATLDLTQWDNNEYPISPLAADAWAELCDGITCISVGPGLRDGSVRSDTPGTMHSSHYAAVMFVPDTLGTSMAEYLRARADRVVVVSAPARRRPR